MGPRERAHGVCFALLPSPLLGSAVWEPVAGELADRRLRVVAVDVSGPAPASSDAVLHAYLRALPEDEQWVLVPHSNAGLYAPAIADRRNVAGIVFVDAGIPPLDESSTPTHAPTTPDEYYEMLAAKAGRDGVLPEWTGWWSEEEVAPLFPHARVRAEVERQQRRFPLGYFRTSVPVPAGWGRHPCAFLGFGDSYAGEAERARGLGWPVRVLAGAHLEMLVHPAEVADAVVSLWQAAQS